MARTGTATGTGAPEAGLQRGRTTVTPRALSSLVCALTADIFGVAARAVRVDLSDQQGLLALTIRTPVRVAALTSLQHSPRVAGASGGTLVQQTARAHALIRGRVTELSGAQIGHITIRLSGIHAEEGSRVR
ncbi:MAG: hypothetical protein ABI255_07195 [Microbacteriaceae bacterium]